MSHTKGEWRLRKGPKDSDKWWDIPRPDSTSCIVTIWSAPDDEETIANARLIAAAPDLLRACERDALLAGIAISETPTGDLRNKLTEINILRLAAIAEAKKE